MVMLLIDAGFIPPPAPIDSVAEIAARFIEQENGIRFGLIVSMGMSSFLMPYAVAISLHRARIEGPFAALALIQLGLCVIFVPEWCALRQKPAPQVQQALTRQDRGNE